MTKKAIASLAVESTRSRPGLTLGELMAAWGRILNGRPPMLSIEITRECPLSCPGCYAYGDNHLGGERTLREVSDLRGIKLAVQEKMAAQGTQSPFILWRHDLVDPIFWPLVA